MNNNEIEIDGIGLKEDTDFTTINNSPAARSECELDHNGQPTSSTSTLLLRECEDEEHVERLHKSAFEKEPNSSSDSDIEIIGEINSQPVPKQQVVTQSECTASQTCQAITTNNSSPILNKFWSPIKTKTKIMCASSAFQHKLTNAASNTKITSFLTNKNGFVLFSAEKRPQLTAENPDISFGMISKFLGMNWRTLSNAERRQYHLRARSLVEANESAERERIEKRLKPGEIIVFECRWRNNTCGCQFDSVKELNEHLNFHVHSQPAVHSNSGSSHLYPCLWGTSVVAGQCKRQCSTTSNLYQHIRVKHTHCNSAIAIINSSARRKRNQITSFENFLSTNTEDESASAEEHAQPQQSEPRTDLLDPQNNAMLMQTIRSLSAQGTGEGKMPYLLVIPVQFPFQCMPVSSPNQQPGGNLQVPLTQEPSTSKQVPQTKIPNTSSASVVPSILPVYRCSICLAEFASEGSAQAHLETAHTSSSTTINGKNIKTEGDDDDIIFLPLPNKSENKIDVD